MPQPMRIADIEVADIPVAACHWEPHQLTMVFPYIYAIHRKEYLYRQASIVLWGWSRLVLYKYQWSAANQSIQIPLDMASVEPLDLVQVLTDKHHHVAIQGWSAVSNHWLEYDVYDAQYQITLL